MQDLFNEPDDEAEDDESAGRGVVREFPRASRRRLGRKIASIDWSAAIEPGHRMAMLTLTYPTDWRTVCPTPSDAYRHLRALAKRYQRATGTPLRAVWKREHQRRGAPHYHVLCAVPIVVGDRPFPEWLSSSWFEIVASGDHRHLRAGTGVDWSEGLRCSSARHAAVYFVAYTGPDGQQSKEYQHRSPEGWVNDSGSVGRWWGSGSPKPPPKSASTTDNSSKPNASSVRCSAPNTAPDARKSPESTAAPAKSTTEPSAAATDSRRSTPVIARDAPCSSTMDRPWRLVSAARECCEAETTLNPAHLENCLDVAEGPQ